MKIRAMRGFWVVVNAKGQALPWTLARTKKGAIESIYDQCDEKQRAILLETNLKHGYSAIRVNVTFEPTN